LAIVSDGSAVYLRAHSVWLSISAVQHLPEAPQWRATTTVGQLRSVGTY